MKKIQVIGFNGKLRTITLPAICIWSRKGSFPDFWVGAPKSAQYGIQLLDKALEYTDNILPMRTKKHAENFVAVVAPVMLDKYGTVTIWYLAPDGKELILRREKRK